MYSHIHAVTHRYQHTCSTGKKNDSSGWAVLISHLTWVWTDGQRTVSRGTASLVWIPLFPSLLWLWVSFRRIWRTWGKRKVKKQQGKQEDKGDAETDLVVWGPCRHPSLTSFVPYSYPLRKLVLSDSGKSTRSFIQDHLNYFECIKCTC